MRYLRRKGNLKDCGCFSGLVVHPECISQTQCSIKIKKKEHKDQRTTSKIVKYSIMAFNAWRLRKNKATKTYLAKWHFPPQQFTYCVCHESWQCKKYICTVEYIMFSKYLLVVFTMYWIAIDTIEMMSTLTEFIFHQILIKYSSNYLITIVIRGMTHRGRENHMFLMVW